MAVTGSGKYSSSRKVEFDGMKRCFRASIIEYGGHQTSPAQRETSTLEIEPHPTPLTYLILALLLGTSYIIWDPLK
jgi:hypothetical protein